MSKSNLDYTFHFLLSCVEWWKFYFTSLFCVFSSFSLPTSKLGFFLFWKCKARISPEFLRLMIGPFSKNLIGRNRNFNKNIPHIPEIFQIATTECGIIGRTPRFIQLRSLKSLMKLYPCYSRILLKFKMIFFET